MKKSRIFLLVASILVLATVLTSCGTIGKILNKKYDVVSDVYKNNAILSELTGYTVTNSNDEFIVFTSVEGITVSYKVFGMNAGQVIATFADTAFTYDIDLYDGLPVFSVAKTEANLDGTDDIIETTYTLLDATGVSVATTDYEPDAPDMFGELVIYNHVAYSVADNGALTKAADVPEYLELDYCDYYNDDYYYTLTNRIVVYDHSFNVVSTWTFPDYIYEGRSFLLNNGDILVQYLYIVDEDENKYDISLCDDDVNLKLNLESYVISADNGKAKKVRLDYLVQDVITNYDLYDEDKEKEENVYNKKFDNIAYILPIVDKRVDSSDANMDIVLMNNKGKAKGSLKLLDGQACSLPEKLIDDLYLVDTLTGYAVVKGNGKLVKAYNNYMERVGTCFVGEVALYDLELNVLYNLVENKAEVIGSVADTVYVRAETDTGYTVMSFRDGASTTLYTYNESDTASTLSFSIVEGVGYKTVDSASGDHKYYNANGELIATTTYELTAVSASEEYGIIVLASVSYDKTTYHVFSVGE